MVPPEQSGAPKRRGAFPSAHSSHRRLETAAPLDTLPASALRCRSRPRRKPILRTRLQPIRPRARRPDAHVEQLDHPRQLQQTQPPITTRVGRMIIREHDNSAPRSRRFRHKAIFSYCHCPGVAHPPAPSQPYPLRGCARTPSAPPQRPVDNEFASRGFVSHSSRMVCRSRLAGERTNRNFSKML